jgi:hypothetical protein
MNAAMTQDFRSGEPVHTWFGAAGLLLFAAMGFAFGDIGLTVPLIILGLAAWTGFRAWRAMGFPYVRLEPQTLWVFESGRARHCISLDQVEGISEWLNRTILKFSGGATAEISHSGFLTSRVRNEFVHALKTRFANDAKRKQQAVG